jgi:hypothetical protein
MDSEGGVLGSLSPFGMCFALQWPEGGVAVKVL